MQRHAPIAALLLLANVGCSTGDRINPSNRALHVTPLALDFGPRVAGSHTTLPVTLVNTGSAPVTLSMQLQRDARGAFSIGAAPSRLEAGAEVSLTITYLAPMGEGPDGASLVLESDSFATAEIVFSISGRSIADPPDPVVEPVDAGGTPIVEPVDAGLPTGDPLCAGAPPIVAASPPVLNATPLPRLAWNGTNNLVIHHGTALEAATLSGAGMLASSTRLISDGVGGRAVFNGTGYGLIAWRWLGFTGSEAMFARLTAAGTLVAASAVTLPRIRDFQTEPALAWNPNERQWGVLWHEWDNGGIVHLRFARLSEAGALLGNVIELGPGFMDGSGSMLIFGGGSFVTLQQVANPQRLQFVRISPAGQVLTTEVASGVSFHAPNVAWNGVEYGLTWVETFMGNGQVKFARVESNGVMPLGSERTLHEFPFVEVPTADLVASGAGWLTTWSATPLGGRGEIFVARLAPSGDFESGFPKQLTCDPMRDGYPILSTGGRPTAIAFMRFGSNGTQVFTSFIP